MVLYFIFFGAKTKVCRYFILLRQKKNMNIIIIGATSGIGLDLLKRYAVSGNKIGILGRRKSILKELERCYPSNVITCAADISQQNLL